MRQCLQNDIAIVISFDVVHANNAGIIKIPVKGSRRFSLLRIVQDLYVLQGEGWIQHIFDVLKQENGLIKNVERG